MDPSTKKLRNITEDKTFSHISENLLFKDGPHVVITFDDDYCTGCYSDIPLYITFVSQGPAFGDPPDMVTHRPKTLDSVSDTHKKLLDKKIPKWRELFGKWDLKNTVVDKVEPQPEPEELHELQLDNLLTVTALTTELIKSGKKFTVARNGKVKTRWNITVPENTMDFIRRRTCEGLT